MLRESWRARRSRDGNGLRIVRHLQEAVDLADMRAVVLDAAIELLQATLAALKILLERLDPRGFCAVGGPAPAEAMAARADPGLTPTVQGMARGILIASLRGDERADVAPVITRLPREAGATVVGVMRSPCCFEGPRQQRNAGAGLAALAQNVDAFTMHRQ